MLFTVVAVAAGVAIALMVGGRPRYLADKHLRNWPLLIAGVIVQLTSDHIGGWLGFALLLLSFFLLLGFAVSNVKLVGMALVGIGLMLNLLTIMVNHGMPVRRQAIVRAGIARDDEVDQLTIQAKHHLERPDDTLMAISDIIPVPPIREVLSFGDLILSVGVADTVIHLLRPPKSRRLARPTV